MLVFLGVPRQAEIQKHRDSEELGWIDNYLIDGYLVVNFIHQ